MTRFLPFGGFRGSDPAFLTERGFTGHKANNTSSNDLGLIYMNARYYVPGIGRFASADTIVPEMTNSQGWNRYSYSYNNPIGYRDPDGHDPHWCGGNTSCITSYSASMANAGATTAYTGPAEHSDWNNGVYSGCTMCHAAVANGQTILTNEQLAAYDYQMRQRGFDVARMIEPIDYVAQGLDCLSGCHTETTLWMLMPGLPGSTGKYVDELDNLGDLTRVEIDEIQDIVNTAGRPLEVVGSAASGTRRGLGTNLPIGKGTGTRSDIDYLIPHSSAAYFHGLEGRLPNIDPTMGPIYGVHNPHIGPAIRFEPNTRPYYVPETQ